MAPTPPTPVPPAPTARTAKPVRLFTAGQPLPSGAVADEAFLDRVVANWEAHQAKGDPRFPKPPAYLIPAASVSLGHEPNSSIAHAYAERTDLPAVGWPAGRLYRDGPHLMAERLEGVPVKLAEWVNAGAYRHVSAEFYEDYEGAGPCLRRVALLGAEVPACKDLGPLPTLVYDPERETAPNPVAFAERLSAFARGRRGRWAADIGGVGVVTFSESPNPASRPTMNPQQQAILDALAAAGIDVSALDGAALDAIIAACQPATNADPNAPPPKPGMPGMNSEHDEPDRKDEPAMNSEHDEDKKDEPAKFSERRLRALMTAAVAAATAPLQRELAGLRAQSGAHAAAFAAAQKDRDRAAIAAFCEAHKDKIFPYELDPQKGPTLIDQLLALPAAPVATFAEGKTSPRQALMGSVAARPPIARFAERLPQPLPQDDPKAEANHLLGLSPLGKAALKRQQAAK